MQGRKIPNVPYLPAGGKLMVKTLLSILISIGLLVTAAVFENFFVSSQFEKFSAAIGALEYKVREKKATPADTDTVRALWDSEKKLLHIVIPHGDIAYIDYWLGEASGCIEAGDFNDALSKIEVLIVICEQIPQQYSVSLENIF